MKPRSQLATSNYFGIPCVVHTVADKDLEGISSKARLFELELSSSLETGARERMESTATIGLAIDHQTKSENQLNRELEKNVNERNTGSTPTSNSMDTWK